MPHITNPFTPLHPTYPHVMVFSKNQCHMCRVTKKQLGAKNVPFFEVNVEEQNNSDQLITMIKGKLGPVSMPVTVTHNVFRDPLNHPTTTLWTGLAPDQIKSLRAAWDDDIRELYAPIYELIEGTTTDDLEVFRAAVQDQPDLSGGDVVVPENTTHRPLYRLSANGSHEMLASI